MLRLEPTPRRDFFRGMTAGWTAALALYLVAVPALSWLGSATGRSLTPCLLRQLSGIPCPLCGGTRATRSLLGGELGAAFSANPLVLVSLLAAAVYAAVWLGFALRIRLRIAPPLPLAAFLLALAANWAYVVSRNPSPPVFLENWRAAPPAHGPEARLRTF